MLTEQRRQFVEEYLKLRCRHQGQAAVNAGYSKKSSQTQACQILKDPEVLEYLEKRKNDLRNNLQQEFVFDAIEARKVLHKIMMDPDASNKDRITAAKDFLDRAGFKPEDNVKISGELGVPVVILEDL